MYVAVCSVASYIDSRFVGSSSVGALSSANASPPPAFAVPSQCIGGMGAWSVAVYVACCTLYAASFRLMLVVMRRSVHCAPRLCMRSAWRRKRIAGAMHLQDWHDAA